jgi:hypothetical protein
LHCNTLSRAPFFKDAIDTLELQCSYELKTADVARAKAQLGLRWASYRDFAKVLLEDGGDSISSSLPRYKISALEMLIFWSRDRRNSSADPDAGVVIRVAEILAASNEVEAAAAAPWRTRVHPHRAVRVI